jgi:hypothetical protein
MSADNLRSIALEVVDLLVREDYDSLAQRCAKSRLTPSDLRAVIRDYGRKLASPPIDAYEGLDAVQVKGAAVPTWSVRVPLWTEEEGRSDLTLDLTIALGQGAAAVELDDLHVL